MTALGINSEVWGCAWIGQQCLRNSYSSWALRML